MTNGRFNRGASAYRVTFGAAAFGLLLGLECGVAHAASALPETVYFAHDDAKYLQPDQRDGGAATFPADTNARPLPLVVFLHGTNASGDLHLWLGGGGHDLRPLAKRLNAEKKLQPFILAGPSQTRAASHGRVLWQDFDLSAFVDDVAQALDGKAVVDRESVVFVGHSGAGCNPRGGLASDCWSRGQALPRMVVAIDPCLDAKVGAGFARRPARVPLWVMWQSAVWPREPWAFKEALAKKHPTGRDVAWYSVSASSTRQNTRGWRKSRASSRASSTHARDFVSIARISKSMATLR